MSAVCQLSSPTGQPEPNGRSGHQEPEQPGQPATPRTSNVKSRVRAYLDANPGLDQLSINQVFATLKQSGVQAGRTTVADVLQERKQVEQIPYNPMQYRRYPFDVVPVGRVKRHLGNPVQPKNSPRGPLRLISAFPQVGHVPYSLLTATEAAVLREVLFTEVSRRWVVEHSFGWAARFRPLARDYERLPKTLIGLHFLAFAILRAKRVVETMFIVHSTLLL
jgi:hypothetical protein